MKITRKFIIFSILIVTFIIQSFSVNSDDLCGYLGEDCCTGNICIEGSCVLGICQSTAGNCGGSGEICCQSGDPCPGLTCQSGICVSRTTGTTCETKPLGCYDIEGNRGRNFNINVPGASPPIFEGYYPQNKCILECVGLEEECGTTSSTCTCPAGSSSRPLDPDESKVACFCIQGAAYFEFSNSVRSNNCCGDDKSDCGLGDFEFEERIGGQSEGYLCSMDENFKSSRWINSEFSKGDIKYLGCSNSEYLSDGQKWIICRNNQWSVRGLSGAIEIDGHEYLCSGTGQGSIAECCGDDSCNSRNAENQKLAGDSFTIDLNPSTPKCDLTKAYWSTTQAVENEIVTLTVEGNNCDTELVNFEVWEYDPNIPIPNPDDPVISNPDQFPFNGDQVKGSWSAEFMNDISGNPEYYFKAYLESDPSTEIESEKTEEEFLEVSQTPSDTPLLSLQPSTRTLDIGDELRVDIHIKDVTDLMGVQFNLIYYPDKLKYSKITEGTFLNEGSNENTEFPEEKIDLSLPGEIRSVLLVRLNLPGVTGDGIIASIYFNTIATGISDLKLEEVIVISTEEEIEVDIKNNKVEVYNFPDTEITYFCNSDGKFILDLDQSASACVDAGFIHTGSYCCGESSELEYYNDGTGGCWNSTPVLSMEIAPETKDSVINIQGSFQGCALDKNVFNPDSDEYLEFLDSNSEEDLLIPDSNNHDYCTIKDNFYCSYKEEWIPTEGKDKSKLSNLPPDTSEELQQQECCAIDECWDGNSCIGAQSSELIPVILNDNICIDGTWTPTTLKFTPEETGSGYCPTDSQCLVDPDLQVGRCIEHGEFYKKYYCQNGDWTTRTKLVALQLIHEASGDYTLFCDEKEKSLNYLNYLDSDAFTYLENNVNNICVLEYAGNVILGTSLNIIDPETNAILNGDDGILKKVFDFDLGCNDNALITDDGKFHNCIGPDNEKSFLWYNKKLDLLIFGKNKPSRNSVPISVLKLTETNLDSNLIENQINPIISYIQDNMPSNPPFEADNLDFKKFERIYKMEQGSKNIIGIIKGKGTSQRISVIKLNNFDTKICDFTSRFNENVISSGILCLKEGNNNYNLLLQGNSQQNFNPEDVWQDLTSKTRIS